MGMASGRTGRKSIFSGEPAISVKALVPKTNATGDQKRRLIPNFTSHFAPEKSKSPLELSFSPPTARACSSRCVTSREGVDL